MNIKDINAYDIIKEAWSSLPKEKERAAKVYIEVDTEDGQIFSVYEPDGLIIPQQEHEETIFVLEAASKAEIISSWIVDEDVLDWIDIRDGRTRFGLDEDELYSCVLDVLHERFEKDINKRIQELLQKYSHLV